MSSISSAVSLALVGCVLAAGFVSAGFLEDGFGACLGLSGGNKYASAYDRIEQDLQFWSRPGDSVEQQMDKISELIANEKASGKKTCHLAALEQVYRLRNALGRQRCTQDSVRILNDNILATRNQARLAKPTRHIDIIVHEYVENHAKWCLKEYFETLQALIIVADKDKLALVNGYSDLVIHKHWDDRTAEPLPDIKLAEHEIAGMTLGYLETVVSDDERPLLDPQTQMSKGRRESSIAKLVRNYLVEPCNYYLRFFGSEVFEPYDFDFGEGRSVPAEGNMEFNRALANQRVCTALVDGQYKPLQETIFRGITGE